MLDNIHLHIFTNCTNDYNHLKYCINKTYNSFIDVFGKIETTVWCDYHPNKGIYDDYVKYLNSLGLNDVHKTTSLSYGYIRAVSFSKHEFNFMLEHDWIFKKDKIKDSLTDIINQMRKSEIVHLRFNKYSNEHRRDDNNEYHAYDGINEYNDIISYMNCNAASNNPHIINTELYKKHCFPLIQNQIEQQLMNTDINFAIYGNKTLSSTIQHLDGKNKNK